VRLEPCAMKVASTVLRGLGGSNPARLPGTKPDAVISTLGVDTSGSYPVANALHEILTPHAARFANLIPFLMQWRDGLPK
jgi:hypothetical protein